MCRTWVFKSSFCGCPVKKWHHPCKEIKAGRPCPGKLKKVIVKECCCGLECCTQALNAAITERDKAQAVALRFKGDKTGQRELYELNEALGLELPGGELPTDQDHTHFDDLMNRYDELKWLADEHTKCAGKRDGLLPNEFEDPEILEDAVASSDTDL